MTQRFILKKEDMKKVSDRLTELKDEWISQKPGRGRQGQVQYLSSDTVVQILRYATMGITSWDFEITNKWKEEVYAKNKNNNQWYFAGIVYHVEGKLTIHGLGSRMQYGKKIAEGGINQQDSAYQAAASTCLNKCAALFGVGEKLYSKNQIAFDHEIKEKELAQNDFYEQTMKEFDPKGYQEMMQEQQVQPQTQQQTQQTTNNQQMIQQNPWQNQQGFDNSGHQVQWQPNPQQQEYQQVEQNIQATDQAMQNNEIQTPFDSQQTQPNQFQAQPNQFQAQPKPEAKKVNYQTQEMGPPADNQQLHQSSSNQEQESSVSQEQKFFNEQVKRYTAHKQRLGISNDNEEKMLSYLRDFFKDENANNSYLNIQNIESFNNYLDNIQT